MQKKIKLTKEKKKKTAVSELPLAVIAHMPLLPKPDIPCYLEEVDQDELWGRNKREDEAEESGLLKK